MLIVLYCAATYQVAAQYISSADKKYYASAVVGWSNNFATFGDKKVASSFGVKSVKKERKTYGANFGIKIHSKYWALLFFLQ